MESCILDVEPPHNSISGRPWFHMMKVILSIYYQLLRYLTPTGTADIRKDQVVVRTISALAQKKLGWKLKTTKAISEEDLPDRKKLKQITTE